MKKFKEYIAENVTTIDGVDFDLGRHAEERFKERSNLSASQFTELLTKIRKHLADIDIKGEFLFYSKKLQTGVVAAWDAFKSRIKLITFLPKGKHFAKRGTEEVSIDESFQQYQIIYVD